MADIFLSYNREDVTIARLYAEAFEREGLSVWWDVALRSGEAYDEVTEAALRGAGAVVVLWSRRSVLSRWVRAEATIADRNRTLIPAMIEPCERPIMFELTQTADLTHWDGAADDPAWLGFVRDVREFLTRSDPREQTAAGRADTEKLAHKPTDSAVSAIDTSERRRATVLRGNFAAGADHFEALDPEVIDERLRAMEQLLQAEIGAFSAVLFQLDSVGFSCVFGVPVAIEDDEVFAAEAAFRLAAMIRADHGFDLQMGLASGAALVAFEPSSGTAKITGNLTASAEALARQAQPGELLVATSTRARLAPYFVTHEAGPAAYSVLERTATRTRIDAAHLVGFSPLIGRQHELAMLDNALDDALDGQGRVVLVLGEPGSGKSRLVHEFRSQCLDRDLMVIQARCDVHDRIRPHRPFIEILQAMIDTDGASEAGTEALITEQLLAIDPGLGAYLPHLLLLLSVPSATLQLPEALEGLALRRALGEAIISTFIAKAQVQPIVLIFDDWHWTDEASSDTLNRLVAACAFHPMLVLVCSRPEAQPTWLPLPHCSQMTLRPLSRADVSELVRMLARADEISPDLGALLHGRTDGIPLFVEELTRSLLEQERIGVDGKILNSRKGFDLQELPSSIEAVVRSRLDRLDRDVLEFLRVGAVIGRHFGTRFLDDFFGDAGAVKTWLGKAIAQGLVQQTQLIPEPEYRFRHVLNQVVAYESLLLKQRRTIHRRYGEWLEGRADAQSEEHLDALAHHFLQAREDDKAIHYLIRAGKRAAHAASHIAASELLRSALALLEKRPPSPARDTQLLETLVALISSIILLDGYAAPEAEALCERARALGETVASGPAHFASLCMLSRYFYNRGALAEAGEFADRMLELATDANDPGLQQMAYCSQGLVALLRGQPMVARQALEAGCALWRIETERDLALRFGESPMVKSLAQLGLARIRLGDCTAGLALLDQALEISREINHPPSEVGALGYLQGATSQIEDWAGSAAAGRKLLELATKYELRHWMVLAHRNDGFDLVMAGQIDEGMKTFCRAIESVEAMGVTMVKDGQLVVGALLAAQVGRVDEGLAYVQQARDLMEWSGMRQLEAEIERASLRMTWTSNPDEALAAAKRTLEVVMARQAVISAVVLATEIAIILLKGNNPKEGLAILEPIWSAISPDSRSSAPLLVRTGNLLETLNAAVAALPVDSPPP